MEQVIAKGRLFDLYASDLERLPFLDTEACSILNIDTKKFSNAIKLGLITKSVSIHFREDKIFTFVGLYDLFEYLLYEKFFFLTYGILPETRELICSLVDEVASVIDLQIYDNAKRITVENVMSSLTQVCLDQRRTWESYWLLGGDKFSSNQCASITLMTWEKLFKHVSRVLSIPCHGGITDYH